MENPIERVNKACALLGIKPTDRILCVSIATQTMQFLKNAALVKSYVISTSRRPPSNVKDSLGTPRGLHAIAERIGAGQPPGMVFKARVPTGRHFRELPSAATEPNLITSRILWLRGLEPGFNAGKNTAGEIVDTHERYIYVHGTNHEDQLGTPLSAGCVLMRNVEIVELYEQVRTGDLVWIED